ncbi:MAG: hypothetical protein RJB39_580 [Candidatus Parcubacteria bacterium]|jgi:Mg2+ and Co2+ transporter CorA
MISKHTNSAGTTWQIAVSPSGTDIQDLMKESSIGSEYFEELSTPTPRPVCMDLEGVTYAVFHIPVRSSPLDPQSLYYTEAEIDVLIGDKTVTTLLYDSPAELSLDVDSILAKHATDAPAELWWHILTNIYTKIHNDIDTMIVEMKDVREKVFTKKEHIERISDVHRAYLAIDLAISGHEEIIESIHEAEHPGHTANSPLAWSKVRGEYHRLTQKLEKLGAYIHELRHTQNSLISARQNLLTQTFTVLAFIFLPINFLAALFGMNVTTMPIVDHPQAFWILLGGFAVLSLIMLLFFKIRKWL